MSDEPVAGIRVVRTDVVGTALFVIVAAVGLVVRNSRGGQIAMAAVSMVLFAVGAAVALVAYVRALERSRIDEIGVANLFLLTGDTAPARVKRTMTAMLVVQVVVGLGAAIVGAVGLSDDEVNTLAFGILVPMFGIGLNGLWAVLHGRFGPRLERAVQPSRRQID
jgi:Na+-transporting NADH:ubiquinone oxidoreductase subunit NqrB